MRRLLLFAVLALMTAITGHAANDIVVVDGVTYEWSPGDLAYIATGWDEETPIRSLHIRSEVNGMDVVGIATGAFEDNDDIVYLTIDEGILTIGENAFARCPRLKVALLPEGLERISEEAFAFCSGLTMMAIPSTVTDIQAHAFSGCTGVTDVYFLMDETQLQGFDWWDGIYGSPAQEAHGGMEFNTNEHTVVHVPQGLLQDYIDSGKLEAWLPLHEDTGNYPLWWIVNFGITGREYTVSDDLEGIYVDKEDGLYAKDDNRWLTPDVIMPGEVDYMTISGMMRERGNRYDQSNWVVLTGVDDPETCMNRLIAGNSITGTLIDKRNPVIAVSDDAQLVTDGTVTYVPNTYIPAAFMGRSQVGEINELTYAFVQPKPQELFRAEWVIYCEDDGCFYLPAPDVPQHINYMGIKGGFEVNFDLYENEPLPELTDCEAYAFRAINRRSSGDPDWLMRSPSREEKTFTPHVDGGKSDTFIVYPLELLDDPIATSITEVEQRDAPTGDTRWYTIDGRCLGTDTPTAPGFYIHGTHKVAVQ